MASSFRELSDWTWLPEHLLDSILNKLIQLSDQIRFSSVCKQWHSVAIHNYKQRLNKSCHNQVPMLMIPSYENKSIENRSIYSITERKIHRFQLPMPYTKRCSGSSHGWLAFAEDDTAVTLINPFTGGTISLPAVMEVPVIEDPDDGYFQPEYAINKVILSADPSLNPNDYEVIAIYSDMKRLAFIRAGDKAWTRLFNKHSPVLSDVIYYKGQVHAVNYWGQVISVDTSKKPRSKVLAPKTTICSGQAYLVESPEGELLMVRRFFRYNDGEMIGMTSRFEVQKLVLSSGELKRVEVENLGGDALFLGDNNSMAVKASEFPGCRPNSIYFTDDFTDIPPPYEPYGPRDMGVFKLDDGSIGMHYIPNTSHKNMPPPIWIVPKLHYNFTSF